MRWKYLSIFCSRVRGTWNPSLQLQSFVLHSGELSPFLLLLLLSLSLLLPTADSQGCCKPKEELQLWAEWQAWGCPYPVAGVWIWDFLGLRCWPDPFWWSGLEQRWHLILFLCLLLPHCWRVTPGLLCHDLCAGDMRSRFCPLLPFDEDAQMWCICLSGFPCFVFLLKFCFPCLGHLLPLPALKPVKLSTFLRLCRCLSRLPIQRCLKLTAFCRAMWLHKHCKGQSPLILGLHCVTRVIFGNWCQERALRLTCHMMAPICLTVLCQRGFICGGLRDKWRTDTAPHPVVWCDIINGVIPMTCRPLWPATLVSLWEDRGYLRLLPK